MTTSASRVLRCVPPTSLTKLSRRARKSADANAVPSSFPLSHYTMQQFRASFVRQRAMGSKMVFNRPAPSTVSYPPSPAVRRVPLPASSLHSSAKPPLTRRIRGSGESVGVRLASVLHRLPCRRAGPYRPTSVRVLAERQLLRVLRRLCQDLPREA